MTAKAPDVVISEIIEVLCARKDQYCHCHFFSRVISDAYKRIFRQKQMNFWKLGTLCNLLA